MFINHVRGHNFRGQAFKRSLGPLTLISGDNFRGKTTIVDAIRLALGGYLPAIGKSSPALWDALAGDPQQEGVMEVEVAFDTGRSSKLTFAKSKKGSVSMQGAVPSDIALDPMLLDVQQFFSMTTAQRSSVIFGASGAKGIVASELIERLGAIQASPIAVRDELLRKMQSEIESDDVDVDKLLSNWKDELKMSKASHKVAAGALTGMTLPVKMPNRMADEKLKELQRRRDELNAKRGELAALLRQDSREAQLQTAIQQSEENISVLRTQLQDLPELPEEAPQRPSMLDEFEMVKDEIKSIKARVEAVEYLREAQTKELTALDGVTICPHCGETGGVDRARERLKKQLQELEASFEESSKKLEELQTPFADIRTVAAEWAEAMREFLELRSRHDDLNKKLTLAEARLAEMKAELGGIVGDRTAQVEKLKLECVELPEVEKAFADALSAKAAFDSYQDMITARTKKEEQVMRLACEVEVLTEAISITNKYVAERGEHAFGAVLNLSDQFTSGILNSPLEFFDGQLGRRVSKMDRMNGMIAPVGAWIPRNSFSGTEDLLAMCGFAVALARMAPFVLVILDEMGRLAPERRKLVADRMAYLLKTEKVHQVIMIDPDPKQVPYPDTAVHIRL